MPATSLRTTLVATAIATAAALGLSSLGGTTSPPVEVEVLSAGEPAPLHLARGAGAIAAALTTTTTSAPPTTTTTTVAPTTTRDRKSVV